MNWLKHAFAIDSPEDLVPNESQRSLIERLCNEIVRRRLTIPAMFTLEMSRPLNYVSAQFLRLVQPFATVIVDKGEFENLTRFMEQRGSIGYICHRLEALEAESGIKEPGGNRSKRNGAGPPSREPHA